MNTKKLTRVLKALANERRLKIICLLKKEEITVSELSEELKVSIKSVSKHLQKLEREGVVKRKHVNKYVYYRLTDSFRKSGIHRQIINSDRIK